MPKSGSRFAFSKIACLLFLSGTCGLIYEVLWSRYLSLFLGNTTLAHTLVLMAFMGGLALGNLILGKKTDQTADPVRFYAWLELGIALWCGIYPSVHRIMTDFYFSIASLQAADSPALLLKSSICLTAVLPASILMGGTLPALSRFWIRSEQEVGRGVAALYAANSAGAVAGTLAAGFFMIPRIGLDASMSAAALLNAAVGIAALRLSEGKAILPPELLNRQEIRNRELSILPDIEEEIGATDKPAADSNLILAAAALSGLCAMIYELAWTRFFSLVLGSSTYAFSLMLAAFISGIALGSWLIYRRRPSSRRGDRLLFGAAQAGIVVALIATLPYYDRLPFEFGKFSSAMRRAEVPFGLSQSAMFLFCFALMMAPTVLSGLCLPLAGRLSHSRMKFLGGQIGRVFAYNTAGTLAGAALAGLVLLPAIGMERTFLAAMFLTLANAALLLIPLFKPKERLGFAILAAAACALLILGPRWSVRALNAGLYRHGSMAQGKNFRQFLRDQEQLKILYHKDGSNATVVVQQFPNGELTLKVNGKTDASAIGDLPTELLLAHLPLVLLGTESPVETLIIGLGSGITAGAALEHPNARVEAVEISPEVAQAARFFTGHNRNALDNPRLKLYVQDAKTFLRLRRKTYDAIISEPSNPWMAGVGGLFSEEHFRAARQSLREGGVMVQWFHAYEMDDATLGLILRTFLKYFPEASLWHVGNSDLILTGWKLKREENFASMEKVLAQKSAAKDLARIGIHNLAALLSLEMAQGKALHLAAGKGPVNSDFFPLLEFQAPKAFYRNQTSTSLAFWDLRQWLPKEKKATLLTRYLGNRKLKNEELASIITLYGRYEDKISPSLYPAAIEEAGNRRLPLGPAERKRLIHWKTQKGDLETALKLLEWELRYSGEKSPETLLEYAELLHRHFAARISSFHRPDPQPVWNLLNRCLRDYPQAADACWHRRALAHMDWGEPEKAVRSWEQAMIAQAKNGAPRISRRAIENGMSEAYLRIESLSHTGH